MPEDLDESFRDINEKNKSIEDNKLTPFYIIIGLIIGMFFYFGYYVLMTAYFKVDPFKFPGLFQIKQFQKKQVKER